MIVFVLEKKIFYEILQFTFKFEKKNKKIKLKLILQIDASIKSQAQLFHICVKFEINSVQNKNLILAY